MGETVLDKGLLPLQGGMGPSADFQLEWLWTVISFHSRRFGGRPLPEALVSWTTIILMNSGVRPTIGEIAKASGMPRPTVSRYIDHQIQQGWAEERVNPENRRRRELYLTEAGAQELEFIVEFFHDMFPEIVTRHAKNRAPASGPELLEHMTQMSERIAAKLT